MIIIMMLGYSSFQVPRLQSVSVAVDFAKLAFRGRSVRGCLQFL